MDDLAEALVTVRQRRRRRSQAAGLLAAAPPPETESPEALDWAALLDVPDWCHWPRERIRQLALVSGALFAAPSMRLWIDARRVAAARSLIGARLFERIMAHELLPRTESLFPDDADLKESLLTAGSSVLLNSLPRQCLRDRLAFLLPCPASSLPYTVAFPLVQAALVLVETQDAKEDSP